MEFVTARVDSPVQFLSIGHFVSGAGWRHMRRTMDNFELIIVRRGILPIRVGGRDLLIHEGEMALIPAGVEHAGTEAITEYLEFVWMHFRFADMGDGVDGSVADDDGGRDGGGVDDGFAAPAAGRGMVRAWSMSSKPSSDDRCVSIPLYGKVADAGRLAVLSNQLLDLFSAADSRPNTYCSYCATALLLEITAQARGPYGSDGTSVTAEAGASANDMPTDDTADGASGSDSSCGAESRHIRGSLRSVHSWIRANAFDDISVADVAARFHYSPSYLTALYRQAFGIGIVEQIVEYRVDRARELLSATVSPVGAIAAEVGYEDPKYFMRVFKRRTGLTPSQYRAAFPARLYNTV